MNFFEKITVMGTETNDLTEFTKPVADELACFWRRCFFAKSFKRRFAYFLGFGIMLGG